MKTNEALFFQQGALSAYDASILYEVKLLVRVVQYLLFIRLNRLVIFSIDLEGLQLIMIIFLVLEYCFNINSISATGFD